LLYGLIAPVFALRAAGIAGCFFLKGIDFFKSLTEKGLSDFSGL
jgi:hypothetical protein